MMDWVISEAEAATSRDVSLVRISRPKAPLFWLGFCSAQSSSNTGRSQAIENKESSISQGCGQWWMVDGGWSVVSGRSVAPFTLESLARHVLARLTSSHFAKPLVACP